MASLGQQVADRYHLTGILGRGGMGLVYEAELTGSKQKVALKVLRATGDPDALARFKREIEALSRVTSPYVARALGADALPNGDPYLVMELLDGHDLHRELAERGPLPVEEAASYVRQACLGIAAAHGAGIVHRDLKPQNLFLANVGETLRLKVLDFGVAKLMNDPAASTLTDTGVAVGTPSYMSPEHLREPRAVAERADVWALGVILYELLSGQPPFADESAGAIMGAIALEDPADIRLLRGDVPEPLAQLLRQALVKDRTKRLESVDAFAAGLEPFTLADAELGAWRAQARLRPRIQVPPPPPRTLAVEIRRELGLSSANQEDGPASHSSAPTTPPSSPSLAAGATSHADPRAPSGSRRLGLSVLIGVAALAAGTTLAVSAITGPSPGEAATPGSATPAPPLSSARATPTLPAPAPFAPAPTTHSAESPSASAAATKKRSAAPERSRPSPPSIASTSQSPPPKATASNPLHL
ncbi:MAG TPA: protein kinase [Polyangiaceae bacterium]|nr:protein kinase [Polyangiaceae bacterium]